MIQHTTYLLFYTIPDNRDRMQTHSPSLLLFKDSDNIIGSLAIRNADNFQYALNILNISIDHAIREESILSKQVYRLSNCDELYTVQLSAESMMDLYLQLSTRVFVLLVSLSNDRTDTLNAMKISKELDFLVCQNNIKFGQTTKKETDKGIVSYKKRAIEMIHNITGNLKLENLIEAICVRGDTYTEKATGITVVLMAICRTFCLDDDILMSWVSSEIYNKAIGICCRYNLSENTLLRVPTLTLMGRTD